MKKTFTLFLALTFLLGGLAYAQNYSGLTKNNRLSIGKAIPATKGTKAIDSTTTITCSSLWINGMQTLEFTMTFAQSGMEYMDGLRMVFPAGMVPNVAGTSDPLTTPNGCGGHHLNLTPNGQSLLWGVDTNSRCGAYSHGTFTFQVNVTNTGLVGDQTINYTVYGDGFGSGPHILTGSIVISKAPDHDLAVREIAVPAAVLAGTTVTPQITVQNYGANNETNWSLTLTDGGAYTSTVSNILINAGQSLQIDMGNWMPVVGEYTLTATLTMTGDENVANNIKTTTLTVIPSSYTYTEDAYALNIDEGKYNIVNLTNGSFTFLAEDTLEDPFPMSEEFDGNHIYRVYNNRTYGIVNPAGKYVELGTMTGVEGSFPTALAYNWANGLMYVMMLNEDDGLPQLCTINLETGELTLIGTGTEGMIIAMDFANDSLLYAPSLNPDNLYSINPTTGAVTAVGPLGININFGQDVSFDATANKLYTYAYGNVYKFGYYDLTTGTFNPIANTPGQNQIATFVITKPGNIAEIATFLTYSFAEQFSPATIDDDNSTIDIVVNEGTDLTNLIATFTLSYGATAKIGGVDQVSGVTPNDFTNPVVYTLTAPDGVTTRDWTVNTTIHTGSGIETAETPALTIYPNPNNGRFTLDFSNMNGKVNYQIFDAKGSFVFGDEFTTNGNTIKELSLDLVPGIYFVKLNSETKSLIKKLIVE